MYVLKDWYNDATVAWGEDLNIIRVKAQEYDEGCEGDWEPELYEISDDGTKRVVEDFKF